MKITYTKLINTVPFENIPRGGCFIDHDGEICMKIFCNGEACAVSFSDHGVYSGSVFNRNVQPVDVELLVHAEER